MNSVPGSAVATARAVVAPLATAFSEAGYRLYLVGGLVRDDLLGRVRDDVDYDLTTDARPETIKTLVDPFADAVWTAGERFGTIACRIDGVVYEITTHRADAYDESSRKPIVEFGDNVHDDLARRDFTVNAIAIDLADGTLVDPFGGGADLDAGRLRTPLDPEISFSDDPLRMLRAARFIATLDLTPEPALVAAVSAMRERMAIVSVERVRDELQKMLLLPDPRPGFVFLSSTGLLSDVLPAIAAQGFDADRVAARTVAVAPEPVDRWAALLLDAPTADREGELRRLKPSGELARSVAWLTDAASWLEVGAVRVWDASQIYGVAMSRSLGDMQVHPFLIPTPEVSSRLLDDKDKLLVLATDGVWDVMENDEAVAAGMSGRPLTACIVIVESCAKRWDTSMPGRRDDITSVVVDLTHPDLNVFGLPQQQQQQQMYAGGGGGSSSAWLPQVQ